MAKTACLVALSLLAIFILNTIIYGLLLTRIRSKMVKIAFVAALSLLACFANAQDSVNDEILRGLGRRAGRVVISLLWNLETIRDQSQKFSVETLEDILGLSRQPHAIRKVLEDVVSTVNKGEPLNGDQIEAMREVLNISTVLDLPFPRLLTLAQYVNITQIVEVEVEFGLFAQATELTERTTTTT